MKNSREEIPATSGETFDAKTDKRGSLWVRARRKLVLGTAVVAMVTPCVADAPVRSAYEPPRAEIVNTNGQCPPETTLAMVNVAGFGDKEMGIYAANQELQILHNEGDTCYIGISFGTEFDTEKNTDVLEQLIEAQELKRVVLVLHSFGGMAGVAMTNEYFHRHPESTVDFSIVFMSSPAEMDDLWPLQQVSVKALDIVEPTQELVRLWTSISIARYHNPFSPDSIADANTAAKNTPSTLVGSQAVELVLGMGKLDVPIPMFYIGDVRDGVVNIQRAIPSIERRSGQRFTMIILMEKDQSQETDYHDGIWFPPNNDAYREPLERVVLQSELAFNNKDLAAALAKIVTMGHGVKLTIR